MLATQRGSETGSPFDARNTAIRLLATVCVMGGLDLSVYVWHNAQALSLEPRFYEKLDVHIHFPAAATPKEGPSAGITTATALVSALTKRAVRRDVAMTGEITLRGRVLPIGGLKEKVLAAHRAGIRTFILPKRNEKDTDEIPAEVQRELRFVFVERMDEVLPVALADGSHPA